MKRCSECYQDAVFQCNECEKYFCGDHALTVKASHREEYDYCPDCSDLVELEEFEENEEKENND
jgi:hypothetical protein